MFRRDVQDRYWYIVVEQLQQQQPTAQQQHSSTTAQQQPYQPSAYSEHRTRLNIYHHNLLLHKLINMSSKQGPTEMGCYDWANASYDWANASSSSKQEETGSEEFYDWAKQRRSSKVKKSSSKRRERLDATKVADLLESSSSSLLVNSSSSLPTSSLHSPRKSKDKLGRAPSAMEAKNGPLVVSVGNKKGGVEYYDWDGLWGEQPGPSKVV